MFKINKLVQYLVFLSLLAPSFWLFYPLEIKFQDRDRLLMDGLTFTPYSIGLSAKNFCQIIRDSNDQIPCNSISSGLERKITEELRFQINNEVKNAIDSYDSLKKTLVANIDNNQYKLQLIEILEKRKTDLESLRDQGQRHINRNDENKIWLRTLLIAQGYSYNEYSDRFKLINYDIARYVITPDEVKLQLNRLKVISTYLPLIIILWIIVYILLINNRLNSSGQILYGIFALSITLGLVVVRDASLNYGFESNLYHLNPFRLLLIRQIQIVLTCVTIFSILIYFGSLIARILESAIYKTAVTTFAGISLLICLITYQILGQALGAESIKITACLICAFLIARNGRAIELAQEYFGFKLLAKKLFYSGNWRWNNNKLNNIPISTTDYFRIFLLHQVFPPLLILIAAVSLASLIFNDLGGSFIAATITVFTLFTLLGKKFATSILVFLSGISVLLISLSDKVRSRFQLMLEPMHANISDFARLIEFERSAQPWGYGPFNIHWCTEEGVCLPLQSLSDYMPTLISGMFGSYFAIGFFCLMAITLIFLTYQLFKPAWYFDNNMRFAYMFASLLCLATLIQLIVTFLGNWRVLPLTGLGIPLVSIGLSSFLAVTIGFALALTLGFHKDE
jgi:cell division protein FtsW (lipid II flippase)